MRFVAEQTILADGRVLEQVGAAQLGMAAPAQFIDGIAVEQGITRGVRVGMQGLQRVDEHARDGLCFIRQIRTLLFFRINGIILFRRLITCSMRKSIERI